VLRVVDFGESDRIAHLLTPATSRLTVIAKGARRSRRRFPGTLDLFNLLAVRIDRRRAASLARLEQARLVDSFPALRASPARFALACYLVELLDRLAPEGAAGREARALFALASGALATVAGRPADARLRVLLELRALGALGLRPELARCVRCGRSLTGAAASEGAVAFHVGEGGPHCGDCTRSGDAALPVHVARARPGPPLALRSPRSARALAAGAARVGAPARALPALPRRRRAAQRAVPLARPGRKRLKGARSEAKPNEVHGDVRQLSSRGRRAAPEPLP